MSQRHEYRCRVAAGILTVALIVVFAQTGWAQQSSGIAGLVRDTSGGVLPGVTVEAASPALIEKVRTVVTDTEGRYNIVNLVPGAYVVTFTLPGFNTFRREGVVLTSGFTALVNADMQVGSLQETITVSGETPIVDVQNVRRQTVIGSDLLAELPSSTKHWGMLVEVTPGFTGQSDVAGSLNQNLGGTYHGKSGSKRQFEGMGIDWSGGNIGYIANSAMVEEVSMQTSGISAETNADGAVVNMIAKSGSNDLRFTLSGLYTNDSVEASNLNADLGGRGLKTVSKILAIYDYGLTAGGPIKRDKLRFFGSFRNWGNKHQMAGNTQRDQGSMFYARLGRPLSESVCESRHVCGEFRAEQVHPPPGFGDQCICRADDRGCAGSGLELPVQASRPLPDDVGSPRTNRLLLGAGRRSRCSTFRTSRPRW
jgi:hypothetical protein